MGRPAPRPSASPTAEPERELIRVATTSVANIIKAAASAADVAHQLQRADALRRVTADIGSRLDLDEILNRLVDHARSSSPRIASPRSFRGGRVAADGGLARPVPSWIAAVTSVEGTTLGTSAISARRPMFSVHYRDDPRAGNLRAAVVQEGFDTVCIAPLLDGDGPEPLGILGVYHDEPHPWTEDELDTMAALATQATVAIKAARNYAQLATWAAQLQSIQQLGTRLNRLTSVKQIGRCDRDRAPPAHRLPQRARLPALRPRPAPGRDAGPGRRVPRRDARAAEGPVRRGHHRLGRRAPESPSSRRRREG